MMNWKPNAFSKLLNFPEYDELKTSCFLTVEYNNQVCTDIPNLNIVIIITLREKTPLTQLSESALW